MNPAWRAIAFALALLANGAAAAATPRACLSDCTPRIGIVSAFGAEADILVARDAPPAHVDASTASATPPARCAATRVVIVLSGVSMINATMVTQPLIDHFRIERLVMSGIAGGIDPAHHVGDVTVPDRWAMPMEVYWITTPACPAPCGTAGRVACLGLRWRRTAGRPPFALPAAQPRACSCARTTCSAAATAPEGEYRFDYPVDAAMLRWRAASRPTLARCGPKATRPPTASPTRSSASATQPRLVVGGRGVSGTAFLANPDYRALPVRAAAGAQTVDMETAALAHVARAQRRAVHRLSQPERSGRRAPSSTPTSARCSRAAWPRGNESAVTLAFLEAWKEGGTRPTPR